MFLVPPHCCKLRASCDIVNLQNACYPVHEGVRWYLLETRLYANITVPVSKFYFTVPVVPRQYVGLHL